MDDCTGAIYYPTDGLGDDCHQ